MLELTILQTADAFNYSPMLRATSRTAIEYCRRHGFAYESFVGIKRGTRGAHAAFNRIIMLAELIDRGYRGWALHMDADAYVHDLDFDVRAYLADKTDHAAIMATIPGETIPWHINSGVLFFNLGHPGGVALVAEWKRRFMAIGDDQLSGVTSVWDYENDQQMLFSALNQNPALREPVLFEDARVFNHHDARFIRQYMNSFDSNIVTRTEKITAAVNDVLQGWNADAAEMSIEERVVASLYRIILKREPDRGSVGYTELVAAKGIATGVTEVVELLLDSAEYKNRVLAEAGS